MKNFIALCKRTESPKQPPIAADATRLLHAAMGMSTEAAEFLDALKKSYFYGRALDHTNLLEEIGDMLWYIAIALDVLGSDFETEMDRVIRKLRTRFPEAYNDVDANLRDLDAERKELEQ
jgi:NTP pyrophosphatase (non-canonical NTP hydrolase)